MTNITNNEENNQGRENYDYINQKPQYNRKAIVISGVSFAAFAILILSLVLATVDYFRQATIDEITAENSAKKLFGESLESAETEEATIVTTDEPDEPVYTRESIELTLYEAPLSKEIVVEPSTSSGCYELKAHQAYAILWDASVLHGEDGGSIDVDIDVSSDYLVKEWQGGTITVSIRDKKHYVIYSGELDILSAGGNLGIEFCADECQSTGESYPSIQNGDVFNVNFYTSGKYVEREHGDNHTPCGTYNYEYGTVGDVSEQDMVCAEEPVDFTLYEAPISASTIVEPNEDGVYVLEMGKIYTIRWDATPLYHEDQVRTDITASSDYLIKAGENNGTISIRLHDSQEYVDYVGELQIASAKGNLGIEFCSEECRIHSYGWRPEISNNHFMLCFYTSGQYVDYECHGVSSSGCSYTYQYGTIGDESEQELVTTPPVRKVQATTPPTTTRRAPSKSTTTPKPDPEPDNESRSTVGPDVDDTDAQQDGDSAD